MMVHSERIINLVVYRNALKGTGNNTEEKMSWEGVRSEQSRARVGLAAVNMGKK